MKPSKPHYYIIGIVSAFISFLSLVVILANINTMMEKEIKLSRAAMEEQALSIFNSIVVVRQWNALHGGVYVKQEKGMHPNPYLKDKGMIKSDKGETLILVNPAWMTRQIFELTPKSAGIGNNYYKITSPTPLNPKNKANAEDMTAFNFFKKNPSEKYYFNFPSGKSAKAAMFMGVLRAEKPCLHCHENIKVGDIRGGIRIDMNLNLYKQKIANLSQYKRYAIIIISFLIILSNGLGGYLVIALLRKRKEIQYINDNMEKTIETRTFKINQLIANELHLRRIMETVMFVNKEIINFHSLDDLLNEICKIIGSKDGYNYCGIALQDKKGIHIAHHIDDKYGLFKNENLKTVKTQKGAEYTHPILQSIITNETIVCNHVSKDRKLNPWKKQFQLAGVQSFIVHPLMSKPGKKPFGALAIFSGYPQAFRKEEKNMFDELAGDLGFAIDSYNKQKKLARLEKEKVQNFDETILSLVGLIEERDSYTAGHSIRVAYYCSSIGKYLKLNKSDQQKLEKAAILHDLGKIATPDSILLHPGKLSPIEHDLVKLHVKSGYGVLRKVKMYRELSDIILYHHERHDGTGYPNGVSGKNIPLLSKILIIADAFDAMTSDRVYRVRMHKEEAIDELIRNKGTQFDPKIAEIAAEALLKVEIPEVKSLFPSTELEKKRFSYFFNDRLTELYNEEYFLILMQNKEKLTGYSTICFISLKNFSKVNKKSGWAQGDSILIQFANALKKYFPQDLIFRVQGDDFILLTGTDKVQCKKDIEEIKFLEKYGISVRLKFQNLRTQKPIVMDKKFLNRML